MANPVAVKLKEGRVYKVTSQSIIASDDTIDVYDTEM